MIVLNDIIIVALTAGGRLVPNYDKTTAAKHIITILYTAVHQIRIIFEVLHDMSIAFNRIMSAALHKSYT